MKSFLNYMGGKSRAARAIAARLPASRCYCEVFGGAAWVLFAREPAPVEVLNDVEGRLINLYRVVRTRPRALARALTVLPRARALYHELWEDFPRDDVMAAAAHYYILKNAFSGRPGCGFSASRREAPRYSMVTDFSAWARRLRKVTVECLDFDACIRKYDGSETAFYLDPPYWGKELYYGRSFRPADHERLRASLEVVTGRWLLSYNDCRPIRRLYKGWRIEKIRLPYSAARVTAGSGRGAGAELLISNYEVAL